MKRIVLIAGFLINALLAGAQAYNPSLHTVFNKAIGIAQDIPTDARSEFYDTVKKVYRPFQSTGEVLAYLNIAKWREGNFPIIINQGGTIGSNGKFIGGTRVEYWFKNGTSNSDLVIKSEDNSGTVAQLRAMYTTTGKSYTSTDNLGLWVDAGLSDGTYTDDGQNVLITANGHALIKRPLYSVPATLSTQIPTLGQVAVKSNDFFQGNGSAIRNGNVITGLINEYTGESETFTKVTLQPELFAMNDGWVDSVMYRKKGSEYFLRNIDHEVNIKWFGATGDAVYMEQVAGANFGKVTQKDHATLATDNTKAFKKAIDFIHNYSLPTFNVGGSGTLGYRTKKLKLVIPSGSYLITSPEVFSKLRSFVTAYQEAGFIVEGDGQNSTEIIYRNDGDTSKFLIENSNAWNGMVFKDLTFKCVTGKEKVYHESSTGTAGFTTFENVGFENFKVASEISGTLNADRGTFRNVTAVSAVPNNTFFKINNPQAIGFVFDHVSIRETDGVVFDIYATGSNTLTGGSSIELYGASCLFKTHPPDIGEQENPVFTSYSTKIELHNTSIWGDINGAFINVYSSNHNTNFSTAPYSLILRNNLSGVRFFESEFRNFKTAIASTNEGGTINNKATLEFHNSRFRGDETWPQTNIKYFLSDLTTPTVDTIANIVLYNPLYFDNSESNKYQISSNKTIELSASKVKMPALSGSGTRMTVVDALGNLSTQPLPVNGIPYALNEGYLPVFSSGSLINGTLKQGGAGVGVNTLGTVWAPFQVGSNGGNTNLGVQHAGTSVVVSAYTDDGLSNQPIQFYASNYDFKVSPISVLPATSNAQAVNLGQLKDSGYIHGPVAVDSTQLRHWGDATGHTVTGTTTETTVYSRTLPGNTLGPNGYMELKYFVKMDSTTIITIYFGGVQIVKATIFSNFPYQCYSNYANSGAQNTGFSPWPDYNFMATGSMAFTKTYEINTSVDQNIVVTLTNAATGKTSTLSNFQAFFYY